MDIRSFVTATVLFLSAANLLPAQGVDGSLGGLAQIQQGVHSRRVSSYDTTGGNRDGIKEPIQPGERRTLLDVQGAGIINHLRISMQGPPSHRLISRNDVILRIYWDGQKEPCVESPIGPFFGQGWDQYYQYFSLPLSAGPRVGRALVSYFAMPFANGARIEVQNDSEEMIPSFFYYIDYTEVEQLDPSLGRFHAWYNHELTEAAADGENESGTLGAYPPASLAPTLHASDEGNYLIADIEGKGHYVGVNFYVHTPSTVWYGEGDDMFFIDGETWPPSLHGTGTEDYFNTAGSPQEVFSHPYYGTAYVNNEVGWLGRQHVYRFHITDPVYFDRSLKFSIEHGRSNVLTLDLASVAYWYQTEPHKKFPVLPSREERAPRPLISSREIHQWRHEWRKNRGEGPTLWGTEPASR